MQAFLFFWGALSLCCCTQATLYCGVWASHRSVFSYCGAWALEGPGPVVAVHWALLLCSMWDLPRPGIKPMSPALAGGFLTTEPLGKAKT